MSQFKYEKLIVETAKALQCFIEEYKRDRPKFLNNNNNNNNNNQQQPQIGELTEDKVKLITTYALLNLTNVNNQKDFNLAVERYLNDLKTSEDGKTYVRYNNTWKEVNFNDLQGRTGRDGYTPYIQNGKWFLNNVDLGVNATGESAYDIAKRLNKPNTDSEENWVNSLKGNKGEQGEKGLKGEKGTGISSITLSNETDKTYLNINLEDNTNSKLLLPLLKGDKGEPGRDVDPAIINRLNQAINNKVDKVDGKQLSTNDFTTAEKQKLESIDLSTKLDKGTYSGTAKDLNDKIEQILTLLRSNNVNLDTLQEIVDYITLNRTKLEALGISNIAGLTQALSDKAPLNHNHDDRYMLKEHKPTWNDIQNKPDNLANSGNIQDLQRKIDQINSVLSQKASVNHTHNWNDIQSKPSINKSGNVYTIPGLGGNIEIPSWVTQTKPTYDWTEIQNKPEIDIELKYKRLTEVTGNITDLLKDKHGVFRVGDSARLQGMPDGDWYHFFGGRHGNWSEQRNFYFALKSHEINNYFWIGKQNNTENVEWFKFIGLKDLANNKLFREWNLEHGLSTYIGNSNVFNVRTGFSGEVSHLLFSLDTEKAYFSKFIVTDGSGILFKDKTQIHVRDNGNIVFGNKPFNDLVIGEFKGIQLWGQGDDKVVLAGGGVKNLSDFDFFKGYIEPYELNVFKPRETGAYAVKYAGGWGTLINFKSIGSTSSLEFFKSNWYPSSRIGVRNSVDSNRFNDDNGAFRYLAWFSDVYREGVKCEGSTTLRVDHQNQVIFVTTTCNIELSDIQNMGSVSFRKVFDGGSVTLSCSGKNIIYTADNQFNGKKGSTAVISIYENDCYIDIRNI